VCWRTECVPSFSSPVFGPSLFHHGEYYMYVVDIDSNMYTAEGLACGGNQCIPYILRYTLLHPAMHRSLHKCGLAPSKGPPNPVDHTIGWTRVTGIDRSTESKPSFSHLTQIIASAVVLMLTTCYNTTYNIPTPDHPRTLSVSPLPSRTSIRCANAQEDAAAHGAEIARLETRASGASGITGGTTSPPMPAASCSASAETERHVPRSTATARPRSIVVGGGAPSGAGAVGDFADVRGPRAGRCARRARAA
jgi:hypothetical protein